eukprot:4066840-Amphidinium_carterae.1
MRVGARRGEYRRHLPQYQSRYVLARWIRNTRTSSRASCAKERRDPVPAMKEHNERLHRYHGQQWYVGHGEVAANQRSPDIHSKRLAGIHR